MQRTSHVVHKTAAYDPRVFAQPTRHSIAAALAAQRREREAFARITGSRVNRDGRMSHSTRRD
jgi:K+/H+ antiporter YhaU regulatory subunit KhtT